jgi:hypothetical protein
MNTKKNQFEYLLSRHYLKKILAAKLISYAEFDEIDRLNQTRFLYKDKIEKRKTTNQNTAS